VGLLQFYAGSRITADELNDLGPLAAVRSSTQSVSSSTTFVNDDTLFLAFDADATYFVECNMYYTAATGGDFKWKFTIPSGATGYQSPLRSNLSGNFAGAFADTWTGTTYTQAQGNGGSTIMLAYASGILTTASAGTLQLQWAQNTSSATATVMQVNSALNAWRVQ
jgi:hypothetical protein